MAILKPKPHHLPLVVITGPTASGKTSLAIEIAQCFGGEIICADSRSVYKTMDIGTAKPSKAEQAKVPHWGLDLVDPDDYFSAADFKVYALNKINEIRLRGNIPFLVGGTGLYIDAVLFDYQFGGKVDEETRSKLNNMSLLELQEYCNKHNITMPENKLNKRYIIRNIERNNISLLRRDDPIDDAIIVGITTDKAILRSRIEQRIEQLFDDGVVDEAIMLGKKYSWDLEAMKGNIYQLARLYLAGELTMENMKSKLVTLDWRLAKRQMAYLKRNKFIEWADIDNAKIYLHERLVKSNQT